MKLNAGDKIKGKKGSSYGITNQDCTLVVLSVHGNGKLIDVQVTAHKHNSHAVGMRYSGLVAEEFELISPTTIEVPKYFTTGIDVGIKSLGSYYDPRTAIYAGDIGEITSYQKYDPVWGWICLVSFDGGGHRIPVAEKEMKGYVSTSTTVKETSKSTSKSKARADDDFWGTEGTAQSPKDHYKEDRAVPELRTDLRDVSINTSSLRRKPMPRLNTNK